MTEYLVAYKTSYLASCLKQLCMQLHVNTAMNQ